MTVKKSKLLKRIMAVVLALAMMSSNVAGSAQNWFAVSAWADDSVSVDETGAEAIN